MWRILAGAKPQLLHSALVLVDEYQQDAVSTLDLNHISRQRENQSTKPNLLPHLRWKGLSVIAKNGVGRII